jgi:hypothetical protein
MSRSTPDEGLFVEHRLRQKSMSMQNASARITAVKFQLRTNAEQIRKDISNAISHQLSCVRAREQELLSQLESAVAQKEQLLAEQQEHINQAIGACQQSLECLLRDKSGTTNVQDILFRLNAIDLRPRDNSHLTFEFDPSSVRRAVSDFGQIVTNNRVRMTESLPLDVEEYEEDASMAHKSVLRLVTSVQDVPRNRIPPMNQSVTNWLCHNKPLEDEEYEFVRQRSSSVTSSSVDVLNKSEPPDFGAHFDKINNSSSSQWLRVESRKDSAQTAEGPKQWSYKLEDFLPNKSLPANFQSRPMPALTAWLHNVQIGTQADVPANERKRTASVDERSEDVAHEFADVISSIANSDCIKWLPKISKAQEHSCASDNSDKGTEWNSTLDKIRKSGEEEWLAPSSRNFRHQKNVDP